MKENTKNNHGFNGAYRDEILDEFEREYQKAVRKGKDSFYYDEKKYETVFARQLIKYLKLNGPPS